MDRIQAGQVRARVAANRAPRTRARLRRRIGDLIVAEVPLTRPPLEGMQEPEPVPDLVDGGVARVGRRRLVAAQPGHRVAVQPAPVLVEVLGAFLHDGRQVARSADAVVEVREEVHVEGVVAASSCRRPEG